MLCYAKSLQSCPTLCDPIDVSPPGSAVPGILQARTLEWAAICADTKGNEDSHYIPLSSDILGILLIQKEIEVEKKHIWYSPMHLRRWVG